MTKQDIVNNIHRYVKTLGIEPNSTYMFTTAELVSLVTNTYLNGVDDGKAQQSTEVFDLILSSKN